ncbi:EAL domain-containing protein [Jatrophihabitans telluris]|uniref:EAL domain-containing protein n=1 Tax=Jatrophihabitans telluris TaxID=2038343 RepID=A0ABY4QWM1_9ACTN|nr:EAL domain-containing protein [Jatrophihabitans telluris]UQX87734.1 EAL domain-containing protein [Jatrophihabitans telluris]
MKVAGFEVPDTGAATPPTRTDADPVVPTSAATSLGYLDGLLRHAGGVMYVRDAEQSRFVLVNPAFEDLVGLAASEILGKTGHDIFPAAIADEHRANDLEVLADGRARTSREIATQADGSIREYISHKFVLTDPAGQAYAIGGISTDVTALEDERRAHQSARDEADARFAAVFEHAPIGQIFSDPSGTITEVNVALATMLGYGVQEMVGRSVADFANADQLDEIRAATLELLAGTSLTVSAIRRFRHRDGHCVPVRVTSALLRDASGAPRWWVSLVVDITEEESARTELDRAHRAAVRSAERLQVLHAIATAANEATDIESAAAHVLQAVCSHFRWAAGVLLRWPDNGRTDHPVRVAAGWQAGEQSSALRLAAAGQWALHRAGDIAPGGNSPVQILPAIPETGAPEGVALPVEGAGSVRYAWVLFPDDPQNSRSNPDREDLDWDSLEVLGLISIETSRLVERQAARMRLVDSEERFRSIFAGSPLPMALSIGSSGTFGEVNDALCELLGRRADELIGQSAARFTHPDDVPLLDVAGATALDAVDRRHRFEMRMIHANGAPVITDVTLTWVTGRDGKLLLLAQMENITARRRAEESLRRQADEDSLTGLANRSYLSRTLRSHAGDVAQFAALFIDLDGFKSINDSRGHEVGDEVLVEVAQRLRRAVRPSDIVARFGGDEFVTLCRGPIEESEARQIARRVEESLAAPIDTRGGAVRVTASVGIACGTIPLEDPTELLQRADAAMYHAKRLGKDRSELYDSRLHANALASQRTEAALRRAIEENRFVLHYQPIVSLPQQAIVGFEALVRLLDDDGTLIAPQHFIPVAEESGLIVPMGTWVLRQACSDIATLQRVSGMRLAVSVNVSAAQAARHDLADTVASALTDSGLDERSLCIELTESALLEADESTLAQLNDLRARGIQISLDDFGTGYSSLTYLRTFPVSNIKVDRSFVAGIGVRPGDLAIVRAVTGLARDLGIGCVAEGIETPRQLAEVIALGAQYGQGYLFSRPVPVTDLLDLLVPPLRTALGA